jgi:N-carbamoylputrescine amidase
MRETVTMGLIQMAAGEDRRENLEHAASMARDARANGADIVVLPELFSTVYFCKRMDPGLFSLAEPVPGPTTDALARLAAELDLVVVGSVFELVDVGFCFNTAVVIDADGTLLGKSRKMHIPQYPHYEEKFYFTPGDTDYPVFDTSLAKVAVATCWDQWFSEVPRIARLKGAELIVYPTAIALEGEIDKTVQDSWKTCMCGHAVANTMYVAAVNRVGREESMEFWGGSFVADPLGQVIQEGTSQEGVVLAQLSGPRLEETRVLNKFLRDRRPETCGALLKSSL